MNFLRKGSKGTDVERWQTFLIGQGLYKGVANGDFEQLTFDATVEFQKRNNLGADGVVGNKSLGLAMQLGMVVLTDTSNEKTSASWPPKPNFNPLYKIEEKQAIFGKFEYKLATGQPDPDAIEILGNWKEENIVKIEIPQLKKVKGGAPLLFHKKAVPQLLKLWEEWEKAGLLHLVESWFGSFSPRFVRGSRTALSNHAYGTAFDINVPDNLLAHQPALVGQKGSVRELVPIANELGFYWGGHFPRVDGMHFEIAKLK